jgi:hypothetical protein
MPETVLQELNRRFPFTTGLSGEALASSIANEWEALDYTDVAHMFRRMAMYVAAHEGVQ